MTLVPVGIEPSVPIMLAISPRANAMPGRFIGIMLLRTCNVQRVDVAATTARVDARVGTGGRVEPSGSVTAHTTPAIVPFVNGTVDGVEVRAGERAPTSRRS